MKKSKLEIGAAHTINNNFCNVIFERKPPKGDEPFVTAVLYPGEGRYPEIGLEYWDVDLIKNYYYESGFQSFLHKPKYRIICQFNHRKSLSF